MSDRPWLPIETAPRDGTRVEIAALEDDGSWFEIHHMMWDEEMENTLFPGVVGFWTSPGGGYTWNEGDGGPTHWRRVPSVHQ